MLLPLSACGESTVAAYCKRRGMKQREGARKPSQDGGHPKGRVAAGPVVVIGFERCAVSLSLLFLA